jgi:SAM-dependent methyltransferase
VLSWEQAAEMCDEVTKDTGVAKHVAAGEYGKESALGYRNAKKVAFRDRVEMFTTMQLVGDLTGKRAIDVACGTGWLTKELKRKANASYVMGTDLSGEMIALAKTDDPTIDFIVEDSRSASPGDFDLVVSNWLLVNARNRAELQSMCKGLAVKVKSGGKLVTLVTNPDIYGYRGDPLFMKKYGFEFIFPESVAEGSSILIRAFTPEGKFAVEVENYYFSKETYVKELEAAGFYDVTLHNAQLSPLPSGEDDSEFWNDLFSCPAFIIFTATKE